MRRGNKQIKKMRRGIAALLGIKKEIQQNIGGHLPYPPKDCEKKEFVKKWDAIPWLDMSICHSCSCIKTCPERKEWIKKLKEKNK